MRTQTPYSEVPELIAAYSPDYKKETFHIHGRDLNNWDALRSVFLDEHNHAYLITSKVFKGALLGYFYGTLIRNFFLRGPKKFQLDRLFHNGGGIYRHLQPLRGYTAYGAFLGLSWYFIKDHICLPHGEDTFLRRVLAYALLGGLTIGTFVHPINAIYGMAAGAIGGTFYDSLHIASLPRGFELKMKSADEEKRAKLLREDEEYEMSQRNVLSTRHNLYPL